MTGRQRRILAILATADRELYGLDLVAAGVVSRYVLYVVLGRMEDLGWIEGRDDASVPPRDGAHAHRGYRITSAGRAALAVP